MAAMKTGIVAPSLAVTVTVIVAAACGDDAVTPPDAPRADAPMPDGNPLTPDTLQETGLCSDPGCTTLSAGVHAYTPRFELWSDTATKRRWMQLPPGTTIDTSNMDRWVFPVGAKFWKEFTRDGVRVETRYMVKLREDDEAQNAWFFITFVWNAAQDQATPETQGVEDANGTAHDVPRRAECRECHESVRPTRVLGFDAIQLDFAAAAGELDLDDLVAMGALSAPPAGGASPHFPLPGSDVDRAALGYLHANCGSCHNPTSDQYTVAPLDLRLEVGKLGALADTPAYQSAVDVDASIPYNEGGVTLTKIITPGLPDESALIARMSSMLELRRMPKLGSEVTDPAGQATLRAWIESLAP